MSLNLLLSAVYFGIYLAMVIELSPCRDFTTWPFVYVFPGLGAPLFILMLIGFGVVMFWSQKLNGHRDNFHIDDEMSSADSIKYRRKYIN